MASDDWFRNSEWNDKIQEKFFTNLGRARSQRDQYLAIQAITLAPNHPNAALSLVDHYFETRAEQYDDTTAFLAKALACEVLQQLDEAVQAYKAALSCDKDRPSPTTNAYLDFPYLVARHKIESEYELALEILDNNVMAPTLPIHIFRWHASSALIYQAKGQSEKAKTYASRAIEAASARQSGFSRHQNLGLVGDDEKDVVKAMHKLGT